MKPSEQLKEHLQHYQRMKPLIAIKEYFMIAVCTIPYALSVNQILVPHTVVGGGLTGLCEIIYFATGTAVPIWLSTLVINLALLIAAAFTIGWRYCIRTVYGVFWLSVWLKLVPIASEPIVSDPFMGVVLGGLCVGSFLGIVFLNNGSTGGTDIIAMIVNKYHHLPMGRVLMTCDICIIICAYFLPEIHQSDNGIEKILFGLCYTFMSSTAVDWVMNRMRQSVQFFIISKKYNEIAEAIMTQVPRGVTLLEAQGGYSKEPTKVITCIARQHESAKIFRLVRSIDPDAFVSQSKVRGVFGQGFDSIKDKA
ncbi:MAG: YitT family protein [Paludibacteraceae bacterium]|nr:YitT family protein [Bacteroidales bacterium]MDY4148753.1 YitT family protein [Paludibacteraceae bacterium]